MRHSLTVLFASLMMAACGNTDGNAGQAENTDAVTSETTSSAATPSDTATSVAAEVETFEGKEGTWGDVSWGSADAPVTVIEYASMTCPHCANFALSVFPKIKEKYIDTGKVRFIFRNYVTNQYDLAASTGARCGTEPVSKELMKLYFARQQDWAKSKNPVDELAAIARKVGVSRAKFDQCLANRDMHQHLVQMSQDGQEEFDITATPTIIVNGEKVSRPRWEDIDEAIADQF